MAQYGNLTGAQQALYLADQASFLRGHTFSVWIAGMGDPTNHIYSINTTRALESARGQGSINIGIAILEASNDGNLFLSGGESNIEKNAKIKILAGFRGRNIPIFSGIVDEVRPDISRDVVTIMCKDYMGLYLETIEQGHRGPTNNTIKLILESMVDENILVSAISSSDERNEVLTNTYVDAKRKITAMEELAEMIFSVPYWDEDGTLQLEEREYKNLIAWTFTNDSVNDCEMLAKSEVINSIEIEYEDNFLVRYEDARSIDSYGLRRRQLPLPLINSDLVSSYTLGATTEELGDGSNTIEGFKFTSAAGSSTINCVAIRLKQTAASGYISCKIYSDDGGSPSLPDTLQETSLVKASGGLSSEGFALEYFYFDSPVNIIPATVYWAGFDVSAISGTVEAQISAVEAVGMHTYYNGSWHSDDNKQMKHYVRGSRQAERIAEDKVRFFKEPVERIKIDAPAVPHLQLYDQVMVDITKPFVVRDRYTIEERRFRITPSLFTSIDVLRRAG